MSENFIIKFNIFGEQIINDTPIINDKISELEIIIEDLRKVIFKIITEMIQLKFVNLTLEEEDKYVISNEVLKS